jgi:hypothetical protein
LTLAAYTMKKFTKILESAQFEVALKNVNLHTEFIVYDNFNFISFLFLCHLYIISVMKKDNLTVGDVNNFAVIVLKKKKKLVQK